MDNTIESQISLGALCSKSWEDMKPFYWQAVIAGVIVSLLLYALNSFLPGIGLLAMPVNLGISMLYLRGLQDGNTNFNIIFEPFNNYGKNLLATLHIWGVPFLFNLLCFIPGIYFSLRYMQALYILAEEPELTSSEAVERSGKLMEGHMWQGLGYYLLFVFAMLIVGVCTFGLGGIFLAPFFGTFFANYYLQLKAEYEQRMSMEATPVAAEYAE